MRSLRPVLAVTMVVAGLLVAAGALAAPQTEVHNPHDAVVAPNCRDCHDCDRPTKAQPCLNACPRHKNNFTGQHKKSEGPEVVVIDQLADLYEPVVFAHGLHAGMSEITGGCENCHHYSEPGGAIPPCRQCHDPSAQQVDLRKPSLKGAYHRQCINCHLDWSHENACGSCHQQKGQTKVAAKPKGKPDATDLLSVKHPKMEPTPYYTYKTTYAKGPVVTFHHGDHVEKFGLHCTDCHQGQSCGRCHDSLKKAGAARKPLDHVTSCIICHGERDCSFCHSNRSAPAFQHATSASFSLAPFHAKVACKTCHGEPKAFKTPATRCTSCHIHWKLGSFDHQVTGLTLDENHREFECTECHADADFARAPRCDGCHDEPMFPAKVPGQRTKRVPPH
jgi:hypothetical protein